MAKLKSLFAAVFARSSAVVEVETPTLVAASLLRFHQIDALLIRAREEEGDPSGSRKSCRVIAGYTVLLKLLRTDPKDHYRFLFRPSESCAMRLASVSAERELAALLEAFESSRFGLACLETRGIHGLVALQDLLPLYRRGILRTSLSVRDVASPLFQLPRTTGLKEALEEMFKRRVRRVFLTANAYITDRGIIGYIFSPGRLRAVRDSPEGLLGCTLAEIQTREPIRCESGTSIEEASGLVGGGSGDCLVCDEGLATPWDLVMKPWMMGKINIGASSEDRS